MFGIDDAAGMGMGMLSSVAQLPFQIKQGQLQKQQRQLQQKQAGQDYAFKQANIQDQQRQMNRDTTLGEFAANTNAADRGLQDSSVPQNTQANMEWERGLRNQALDRRTNYNAASFQNEQQGWQYQRQQQRASYYSSMINSIMGQGAQGGMGFMGGGK